MATPRCAADRCGGGSTPRSRWGARLARGGGAEGAGGGEGGPLPLTLNGARDPLPVLYRTPVASAQIKSAVLLAGLSAPGVTTVIETEASRDHTELMLKHFGARIVSTREGNHGRKIALTG